MATLGDTVGRGGVDEAVEDVSGLAGGSEDLQQEGVALTARTLTSSVGLPGPVIILQRV